MSGRDLTLVAATIAVSISNTQEKSWCITPCNPIIDGCQWHDVYIHNSQIPGSHAVTTFRKILWFSDLMWQCPLLWVKVNIASMLSCVLEFTWKLILANPAFSLSFEFLICTFCCYILGQLMGIIMLDYPSHYEAYNSFVDQGSQDPHFMVSACAMCSPHVQLDHAT